jgi:acyl transferase domain-containing protein
VHSGFELGTLAGTRTGVFVGLLHIDCGVVVRDDGDTRGYVLTGMAPSVVSGRIACTLRLE